MWVCGLDWACTGQGQVADACECGNEPSGCIKCGEFLDQLQTSQLLKKDSAPWSKYVLLKQYTCILHNLFFPSSYVVHISHPYHVTAYTTPSIVVFSLVGGMWPNICSGVVVRNFYTGTFQTNNSCFQLLPLFSVCMVYCLVSSKRHAHI